MASVKIGSARIDENGKAYGGQAGDQTGREVSTQNWYKHEKGWVCLRPRSADAAEKIAAAMQAACDNSHIGYDQWQRLTLYDAAKPYGFDPAKVTTPCETDCSALVRVCCAHAGILVGNFNTTTQASVLMASGAFERLDDARYTERSDDLRRGDVLVTKTQGHTVVVLTDGANAGGAAARPTLRKGSRGADVKTLQNLLIAKGRKLPRYGADGDFGGETETAVRGYQTAMGLTVDGIVGARTWAALLAEKAEPAYRVVVSGLTAAGAANMAEELRRGGFKVVSEVER